MQNEITLDEDVQQLTGLLKVKIRDGLDKQLAIYSCFDKRRPPHSLVYNDPDTVPELEAKNILKIDKVDNNIDEASPGFAGPPYYIVTVFADKPLPLPQGVTWRETENELTVNFSDGKSIVFPDRTERSAQYFKMLLEKHCLPVKHADVMQRIKGVKSTKEVRSLIQTIKEKITHHMLQSRIKLDTKHKSAYILTITFSPKK